MAWSRAWTGSDTGWSAPGATCPACGDTRAHLDQAVESAPSGPGSRPAVGVEADVDEAGPGGVAQRRHRGPGRRAHRGGSRGRGRRRPPGAGAAGHGPGGHGRSSRAQRLPRVTSGTTPGSSHPGGSMRRTSAPHPARRRVATGPGQDAGQVEDPEPVERPAAGAAASASGRRGRRRCVRRGRGALRPRRHPGDGRPTPRPTAWRQPPPRRRPPRTRGRRRSSGPPRPATASRSPGTPSTPSAAARWWGALVWSLIHPSAAA